MAVESSARWLRGAVELTIAIRLGDSTVPAGGPVLGEVRFTNRGRSTGCFLTASDRGRPAYLQLAGELIDPHLSLRDALDPAPALPEGPIAAIDVPPGETREIRVVVNQFLCLEDTRAVLPPGASAVLRIDWRWHMAKTGMVERRDESEVVGGRLEIRVLRDDQFLRASIAALAERLEKDRAGIAADPVGRREASVALTSLRVPEAVEACRRLATHPDLEVRMRAEQALRMAER